MLCKAIGLFFFLSVFRDKKRKFIALHIDDDCFIMRIVFFSDIHGVPSTLWQLLRHADALKAERLVLCGDVLYHGPRNGVPYRYEPNEVVELLNARKDNIVAVRGNCDCEVDQMLLKFPMMADYSEIISDRIRFFVTHGHMWNANNLPTIPSGSVLVHGHTHVYELRRLDASGIILMNPGSISLPKQNAVRSFGFFDGFKLSIHDLERGEILSELSL